MSEPTCPTHFPPRSPGRIRVYAERAALGLPIFNDNDAPMPERVAVLALRTRNGIDSRGGLLHLLGNGLVVELESYVANWR
jgi:hypothetical protein